MSINRLYSVIATHVHIIFVAENTEPAVNNSTGASESLLTSVGSSLPSSGAPGSLPSTSAGGSAPPGRQSLGSG